jgi:hypothetical protein
VPVEISLDGGATLKTVTTSPSGSAKVDVTVPPTTSVGSHQIVVTAADGGSVSAALQVQPACVPLPRPGATLAQVVAWLVAVLTGSAC